MENQITCNVCGGTNFHKDSGYYYCNECQTQSQDIQERVFAFEEETATQPTSKQKSSKKVRKEKQTVDRLTTWECYNYILRGLVEELIQLGADIQLKNTVQILWFKYLNILEVTKNTNDFPKLGAVNSKLDAEVIYKRSYKRKRKSGSRSTSPSSSGSSDSPGSRKDHTKKRRSFILSEYNEMNLTLQSDDVSLGNVSLSSLRTNSDVSSKDADRYLQYNRFARKQLLKTMKKGHLKKHIKDVHEEFHCHKPTYRKFSVDYVQGPATLSRIKIYALLYLALLINKDNIQLGDLIRFVREGHLSYHNVKHFYPEDFDEINLNLKSWNEKQVLLSHSSMRKITAKLAHFLDVTYSVPIQNVVELCRRYSHELNLPDEVWGYCINLISLSPPHMKFTKKSSIIPNYEGRAISTIIFLLKLMFGVDDQTEHYLSERARQINESSSNIQKMFVWDDWIFHLQYRKLLLSEHHFPSQYLYDNKNVENTDLFVSFATAQDLKFDNEVKYNRESEVIQQLLEKSKEKFCDTPKTISFPLSLTPFRNYTEILGKTDIADINNYLKDCINSHFNDTSIKF